MSTRRALGARAPRITRRLCIPSLVVYVFDAFVLPLFAEIVIIDIVDANRREPSRTAVARTAGSPRHRRAREAGGSTRAVPALNRRYVYS